jgi:molybdopterin-guanine dinucleotide biosynthesis protein A
METSAGFVLCGGRSTHIGRDKALLPVEASGLVERIAERVRTAAGHVTLIGAPERYQHLGIPAIADLIADCGPIGGLYTALKTTSAEWNLLVACDMPGLTVEFLRELLAAAIERGQICLVPETGSEQHPLCAVYHRSAQDAVEFAILHKRFEMHALARLLNAAYWPVSDASVLQNVNTPLEWSSL